MFYRESLKLKVNKEKSKVSRPVESTLLGFSFYQSKGKWEIRIANKSIKHIKEKTNEVTARSNGSNTKQKLLKLQG